MSDCRPSKPEARLWTDEELDRWWDNRSREEQEQAIRAYDSAIDPVAVVRRGVESGTIKGEVVRWCRVHEAKASARWDECHVAGRLRGREEDCSIVVDLRIPVSDGGSET